MFFRTFAGQNYHFPYMFERLQHKWKVRGLQLALILCTFAIGGSLTGYAGRKILDLLPIGTDWLWIFLYILLITLLWPVAVLLVSLPLGQYRFFIGYLKKIGKRFGLTSREAGGGRRESIVGSQEATGKEQAINTQLSTDDSRLTIPDSPLVANLALFASGAGSNAQKIIDHFRHSAVARVALIACNRPGAGVLAIAQRENIPALLIEKERFFRGDAYLAELREKNISFIVLAGFLWKIPSALIQAYPSHIINIHPALLPLYGGKGMYGDHVHAAVIAAGDAESGITIHYVDDQYDHGAPIFQVRCPILPGDTADSLAERIHRLEHEHYPRVIEEILSAGS